MHKKKFGIVNEKDVFLFSIKNKNGMELVVSNYGGIINKICVPDKNGNIKDVVLGYDTIDKYMDNPNFFGAIVGPSANRIKDGSYVIDDIRYQLDKNDGNNNLHSHREKGLHKRVWDYKEIENGIEFFTTMNDGDLGFGGNKKISVKYIVTDENEIQIYYNAISDKNTLINMTNHSYFNLNGHGNGNIKNHSLQIFADGFTKIDKNMIPTGEILPVKETPLDFTKPHKIGERLDSSFDQLKIAGGYDHNFVLNDYDGKIRKAAVVENDNKTCILEVYTDLPGMQFYSANMLEPETGKDGKKYSFNSGFALETQYYPDSINKNEFPSPIFGPGKEYKTTTIYKFVW